MSTRAGHALFLSMTLIVGGYCNLRRPLAFGLVSGKKVAVRWLHSRHMYFFSSSSHDRRLDQGEHSGRRVGSALTRPAALEQMRLVLSLILGGGAPKMGSWCSALITAVALLLTGPTPSGLASWSAVSRDDAAPWLGANEERHSSLTSAIERFGGCEASALTDFAEEIEVESLPVTEQHETIALSHGTSESLATPGSAHEFFKPAEWLRAQHAPRGPPVS